MTAPIPQAFEQDLATDLRSPLVPLMSRAAQLLAAIGVFFAPYLVWRVVPDVLFTVSDAIFCLCAGLFILGRSMPLRPFGGLTPIWFLGLMLALGALLISSILNGDVMRFQIAASQYFFAFAILPILLMRGDRTYALRLVFALVIGVTVMELFGAIVYYVTGASYTATQAIGFEFITGAGRLGAFMADANANAAMIAMTLPFVMYLFNIGMLSSLATLPLIAILILGLLMSGSFTGFASASIAAFIFTLVAGGGRLLIGTLALTVIGSLLLATGTVELPAAFKNRVAGAIENQDLSQAGTFLGRMAMIKEAWEIADNTSLVGLGTDQFRVHSESKAPVHNMYLLMWTEGGIPALLGWVIMVLLPLAASIQAIRSDRRAAGLALSVTIAFIGFSMAAPHMYARNWVIPLLIAMSVLFGQKRASHPAPMV